jgi:hypothetical protein
MICCKSIDIKVIIGWTTTENASLSIDDLGDFEPMDLGVEIAYIQGHRTPRNSTGRIELRYLVALDVHYTDSVIRTQATEMNAKTMGGITNSQL